MLDNKSKKFKLSVKPTKALFFGLVGSVLVGLFIWSAYLAIQNANPKRSEEVVNEAGAGAGKAKNTGFDGRNQNELDPLAIDAYCADVVEAAKNGEGAKIKDLCVLNEITREYIPLLSDAELAELATSNPSCLDTGYDSDGFNCFTDFDKNGCSRSGLDENGNECENVVPRKKDVVQNMFAQNANICDLVSGCNTEEEFDTNGMNSYGCNRQGRREDGSMCPYEYITKLYDENNLDQMGFSPKGFNKWGCDVNGFRENGEVCPIDQVTRVIGKNGKDIYGFGSDGFNEFNCNIKGLNRDGKVCKTSDITRVLDPKTGLDQFGFGGDGFNENNCDIDGYNRSGELCALEDMTLIYGKDGLNQLKLRANGFNAANCNLEGYHPDGSVCSIEDTPRLFSKKNGKDQFGFHSNNLNDAGCNFEGMKRDSTVCSPLEFNRILDKKTKLDRLGMNSAGFNENNCNLAGFKPNGERCSLDDVTRVVNKKTGLDQFGIGSDGFNLKNCNALGFDRNGNRCALEDTPRIIDPITGLDQFGFREDGFNENNCDINGLNRDGEVCALSDITRIYDPKTGFDQFGISESGFNEFDCNLEGVDRNGVRCSFDKIPKIYDSENVDQLGFKANGLNSFSCDFSGRKPDGTLCLDNEKLAIYDANGIGENNRDADGFNRLKFDDLGYNENNCDINGLTPEGKLCAIEDITRVYDPITKLDQFGLTKDGFNEWNCGLDGLDREGNQCKEEHIPYIYDSSMNDQFGNSISDKGLDALLAEQVKTEDLTALLGNDGEPVFFNGEQVFKDKNGVLRFADGKAVRNSDGEALILDETTGTVKSLSGKTFDKLKNKAGERLLGGFDTSENSLSPMLDSSGNEVFHNGKAVFVDSKDGSLRYADGTPVYDENGKQLFIGEDGLVVDELGSLSKEVLTSKQGRVSQPPFHSDYTGELKPLLGEDGEPAYIDGKQVFVDENGALRFEDGSKVTDENGDPLYQKDGVILSSKGEEFDDFENSLGASLDGPFIKDEAVFGRAIIDENGAQMYIDGKPVFADKYGNIVDSEGQPVLVDGKKLVLGVDGVVRDEDGEVFDDYKTANGDDLVGLFKTDSIEELSAIVGPDGSQLYVDGKPVFSDKNGNLYFEDGSRALDSNGSPLSLKNGKAVNEQGQEFALKDINGDSPSLVYKKDDSQNQDRRALLNENGEAMFVDGKQVFVDEDGVLRFSDGSPALDENGFKLKLGEDGIVRNEQGVETKSLRNKAGRLSSGKMSTQKLSDLEAVIGSNGEAMFVDGKQVFADEDGVLRFADGSLALDSNGSKLTMGKDGLVRDELGLVTKSLENRNGDAWSGKVETVSIDELEPLFDENGEAMFVDGKQVFADEDGVLRFADGSLALDENGSKLTLGNDGVVRNNKGVKTNSLKTSKGLDSLGDISPVNTKNLDALLNDSGEALFIDGKQVFADEDGVLRFADGSLALDENGSKLTLGKDGVVRNSQGIATQSMKNREGETFSGKVTPINTSSLKPMYDSNGEDLYVDGKKVFADENGVLRFADGSLALDKNGSKLTLGKDGVVRDESGVRTNQITNRDGVPSEGVIKTVDLDSLEPVLDENGQALYVDGKQVFADENGVLRFSDGKLALDDSGSTLTLGDDGVVRDESGVKTESLKTSKGQLAFGKIESTEKPVLEAILNKDGEAMLIDGKPVFSDENGLLRFADGSVALDSKGSKLVLGKDGRVLDENGLDSKEIKNRDGEVSIGGMTKVGVDDLETIYDANGETLFVDGKQVFADKDGVLRFADGSLALDKNGSKLTLGSDGLIRNEKGYVTQDVLTQNGQSVTGEVGVVDLSELDAVLNSDGEAMFVDGKQVFADENGVLRFSDGSLALDDSGSKLTLGKDGVIRNQDGSISRAVLNKDGVFSNQGMTKQSLGALEALVDANGEPMFVDGKQVFVDEDGVLRFSDGSIALDASGSELTLGDDGVVRNAAGEESDALETSNGEKPVGLIKKELNGLSAVLDENGNAVFVNGKKVLSDEYGNLYYEDGSLVKNADNEPLKLGANGAILSPGGEVFTDVRNSKGELVTGILTSDSLDTLSSLVNKDGNEAFYNGKPVFVDSDGTVRYADGTIALDENGKPLSVNAQGMIVDSKGKEVSFSDKDGNRLDGPFVGLSKAQLSGDELPALTNAKGEQLTLNGEEVFVDKQGNLRNSNGDLILGENGLPLKINNDGLIVDSNGKVIPSSNFKNLRGESASGSLFVSEPMTKHALNAKNLAEKISLADRIKLGLGDDGYNHNNCDLAGLNREGEVCELSDIPRLFDKDTGLDQFKLGQDGHNIYGCDLNGLNRDNEACPEEYVTVIRDKDGYSNGVNALGLNKANLTAGGVDQFGCDLEGNNCSKEDSPKMTDSAGVDQFGKRSDGRNRIGFSNDYNENGCSIDGLKANGEICELSEITKLLNSDGVDQFGVDYITGLNSFGCGLDGLKADGTVCKFNEIPRIVGDDGFDQNSLNSLGRNKFNCNLSGFDQNGEVCELSKIPRIIKKDGFDQLGIGEDGFNKFNCNIDGLNREGEICPSNERIRLINQETGLDQLGFGPDGFNENNCDINGLNRSGELCSYEDITKVFNSDNVDQFGFGEDGFNDQNCNFYGYNREGQLCSAKSMTRVFDSSNTDQFGVDKDTSRNEFGCNVDGFMINGDRCKPSQQVRFKNAKGVDKFGLVDDYNENGCDLNGLDENGEICSFDDVTKVVDPYTGLDQFDLDDKGENVHGCGLDGLDENGDICELENIPRIFDANNVDQFGIGENELNKNGCDIFGFKEDGTPCSIVDSPRIFGEDHFDQFGFNSSLRDRDGNDVDGYDLSGCDANSIDREGNLCPRYRNLKLTSEDGVYIASKKQAMTDWLSANKKSFAQDVVLGTYKEEEKAESTTTTQEPVLAATPITRYETPSSSRTGDANSNTATGDKVGADVEDGSDVNIPAGYMTSVYVKTPVNSDYTETVYADVSMGELEGATLVGSPVIPYIDNAVMPRDKFYYKFDKMIYNRMTIPIDAITIELGNDSGMVEADDVDYHRFQRYGGVVLSAAIQALDATFLDSQAEKDAADQAAEISELANSSLIYGNNVRELTKENLKTVTQHVSDLAQEQFNRRPTITKGYGPQVVIFRTQIKDARLPMVFVGIE